MAQLQFDILLRHFRLTNEVPVLPSYRNQAIDLHSNAIT